MNSTKHNSNSEFFHFLATLNLFMVTCAFLSVYVKTLFWNLPYPENTFLSPPESRFGDLYSLNNSWQELGFSGVGYSHSYFPGLYALLEIFHLFCMSLGVAGIWILMLMLCLTVVSSLGYLTRNILLTISCSTLLIVSYPTLLIWSTGNIEAFVAVLLLVSTVFLVKRNYVGFLLLIGIAGSAKLFPLIFLLILFYLLPFKKASLLNLLGLLITVGVSFVSMFFLRNGVNSGNNTVLEIIEKGNLSRNQYADLMYFSDASIPFGHSFLNGIHGVFGMSLLPTSSYMYVVAITLSILLFIPCLLISKKVKAPTWITLTILGAWSLCIVPTSTDYRLIYLWPGLVCLIGENDREVLQKFSLIWITLILAPKPYFPTEISKQATFSVYGTSMMILLLPIILLTPILIDKLNVKDRFELRRKTYESSSSSS